jgi:hypothetical protein
MRAVLLLAVFLAALAPAPAAGAEQTAVLQLQVSGPGGVSTTPEGRLWKCPHGVCSRVYPVGTVVRLSASPWGSGASFAGWDGACEGERTSCEVRMTRDRSVVAGFSPVRLFLEETSGVNPNYVVNPPGRRCGPRCRSFPWGTRVTVQVPPRPQSTAIWFEDCPLRPPVCRLRMVGDRTTWTMYYPNSCDSDEPVRVCPAPLTAVHLVASTIRVRGPGEVRVHRERRCRSVCGYEFPRTSTVTLSASPKRGRRFVTWRGACRGAQPTCQFVAFNDLRGRPPAVGAVFR